MFGTPGGRQLKFGSFEVNAVYLSPIGWLPLNFSSAQAVIGMVFTAWPCRSVQRKLKVFTEEGYHTPVRSPVWTAVWFAFGVCPSSADENVVMVAQAIKTSL